MSILLTEPVDAGVPPGARRPRHGRTRVFLSVLAVAAFATAMSLLVANLVSERQQFHRAQLALHSTDAETAQVSRTLGELRHVVVTLKAQVRAGKTSLHQDQVQLKAVDAALQFTQAALSGQSNRIAAFPTCLGGVQQALNALAINDQAVATFDLAAVQSSCTTALGS